MDEKSVEGWKKQWVACCENLDAVAKERDCYKEALEDIKKFRKDWSGIANELQQIAKKALKKGKNQNRDDHG